MNRLIPPASRWLPVSALLLLSGGRFADAQVRSDEEVIFFPTAARLSETGDTWTVPIHGWIYEPEQNSLTRRAVVGRLSDELELEDDADAAATLAERSRWLMVDNERGKEVEIAIGNQRRTLPASGEDGHFEATLQLSADFVARVAMGNRLSFRAVLPEGDAREFVGTATLVPATGMTVISDIDDTVKVSEVTRTPRLLRRTFVEPFEAVEGMAERYQAWHANGTLFWFVSSSPWQLYAPLETFLTAAGFPPAVWQMKRLRLLDSSVLRLFSDPYEYKLAEIAAIMDRFPGRRFVLIGDSGEKDPETFGEIARRFPDQVVQIAIRDVTDESAAAERYQAAFRDVPRERWQVFLDPAEVELSARE